jgi:hypothetical protein
LLIDALANPLMLLFVIGFIKNPVTTVRIVDDTVKCQLYMLIIEADNSTIITDLEAFLQEIF